MQIKTSQQIFITGQNRSGKSVLAKSLLSLYPRVVFHDRKWEHGYLTSSGYVLVKNLKDLVKVLEAGRNRVLYQPTDPSAEDFDIVCHVVYAIRNCLLLVDEAQSLCPSNKTPYWFSEILRLGAIRNVGCISLTQRPMKITTEILSEAHFIFVFRLSREDDRKMVIGTIGKKIQLPNGTIAKTDDIIQNIKKYHFILYDGEKSVLCSPIPYKGGQ